MTVRSGMKGRFARALVVTAHPDDVDFLASGTVAQWTAAGVEVSYCVVTDGDAGGTDPGAHPAEVAAMRRAEQLAAAKIVGVDSVRFLGYPDGSVSAGRQLRRDLTRVLRQVRPQRVVMHSPEINWPWLPDFHPDHRACGEATLQAVYPDARNPLAHPELLANEHLEAWHVGEIWMVGSPSVNHSVDVTDQFELKIAALRAHSSQTDHVADLTDVIRDRLARQAIDAGMPPSRLAEAFQVVDTS